MGKRIDQLDFEQIKRATIRAPFADDELADRLVLKGGNALGIVYNISTRASLDLDFSTEFDLGDVEILRARIDSALIAEFQQFGLQPFDVTVVEVPPTVSDDMKDFWGGYKVNFKLIDRRKFLELRSTPERLQRESIALGARGSTRFCIDISKFECCDGKQRVELDNFPIYVYSPLMVVCEKLRAICQQTPEYVALLKKHTSGRSRDFVDIIDICRHHPIDFGSSEFQSTLRNVFKAKRVPLRLLGMISHQRSLHAADFQSVQATVRTGIELQSFDFYFDRALEIAELTKPLWDE